MITNLSHKTQHRIIQKKVNLLEALKKMDDLEVKSLLVFEKSLFLNILSIGDIQRAIIRNLPLQTPVAQILRETTTLAKASHSFEDVKQKMLELRTECMPVVNDENQLVKVYFWEDVFEMESQVTGQFDLPVVIMAGGKGSRLKPITNILPKPLIPLGHKTILEHIMDRFVNAGSDTFHLSVNYKADIIKYYFNQLNNSSYNIQYFQETKPLGTAGSLYLLNDVINCTFFISNCDILINTDYSEILKYHQNQGNELTIVSVLKHYKIPYGTLETKEQGRLLQLNEKPELTFKINSGMYILEPHLLQNIPEQTFFHITDLIESILKRNGRVGVFPVSPGSWKDIGQWDEYLSIKDDF